LVTADNGEELWATDEVAQFLNITINNLRQIQHRGQLEWKKRVWRSVYYSADEVRAFKELRENKKRG
jgi:transposase